jgi:restriction endonuclease S subunit
LHRKSRGIGARRESVSPNQFLSLNIALPPLAEQKRIVLWLNTLATQCEEAIMLRQQATEEAESLLAAYSQSLFQVVEHNYGTQSLLDSCKFVGGNQPPKSTFRYEPTIGYVRFLKIRDFSSDDHLTFTPSSPRISMVESHEILIGRYGASLGKILRGKEGAYNVAMCEAMPIVNDLDYDFLAYSLKYGQFQKRISEISRSAQAGFNKGDLKSVGLAIPPIFEQRQIVVKLDNLKAKVDTLKRLQSVTAIELHALLPSVLDLAFKGEL